MKKSKDASFWYRRGNTKWNVRTKISEIVRMAVKEFMESIRKGEIQASLEENGKRNGYYERDLLTNTVK